MSTAQINPSSGASPKRRARAATRVKSTQLGRGPGDCKDEMVSSEEIA